MLNSIARFLGSFYVVCYDSDTCVYGFCLSLCLKSLLDLLVLYPREVIPYVADIVGGEDSEVEKVLSIYSDLLQGDRSLLTLIVGSASELPLDETRRGELHDTLSYALTTVEQEDVPTIVHAIVRTDATQDRLSEVREKTRALKYVLHPSYQHLFPLPLPKTLFTLSTQLSTRYSLSLTSS